MADLIRHLNLEVTADFLGFSSYGSSPTTIGQVKITKDLDMSIEGLDVLVIEDILDTGLTFQSLQDFLKSHKPRSLKVATLLDKASRRVRPVRADYVGFTIPDKFVVGYGLDFAQKHRGYPEIRVLELSPEEEAKVRMHISE
jgi:hypoxanthine phosphoribosyltransferase